jgi:hypothetical protein
VTAKYQVVAQNTVGYGGAFPSMTVSSTPATLIIGTSAATPSNLVATLQAGPQISLTFTDNATNEVGFVIERSTNGAPFVQIATAPARTNTGNVTYVDTPVTPGNNYAYRVAALNAAGNSGYAVSGTVAVPAMPVAPGSLTAANGPNSGNSRSVVLNWIDNSNNETGFTIQRATNNTFTGNSVNTTNVGAGVQTLTQTGLSRNTQYWYRIRANNGNFVSSAWVNASPFPIRTNP